uniref:Bowman-Birk serine protease inhibitors family domain-containing protein n=1 Tax=Oryza punctata TaxID=4537 RepID=A0A0E0JDH9_ORYPU
MAASILFFLFLLAGIVTATTTDSNIRLPSNAGETDGKQVKSRPWECCDNIEKSMFLIYPPRWRCNDEVKQCAAACENCLQLVPGEDVFVCDDWYPTTNPGPVCTPRPWGDCCDKAFCTRSLPPICHCMDKVESCAAACKECDMVESSEPPRFICRDHFTGEPGPKCA